MDNKKIKIPSRNEAEQILNSSYRLNSGDWVKHSRKVGETAKRIAEKLPNINPDVTYVIGILHDIGHREGSRNQRHILDGYNFMMKLGYPFIARICLTHSFPHKQDIDLYHEGRKELLSHEIDFIKDFLDSIDYSEYDLLIQLCDALVDNGDFCLIEKRLVNVVLRYRRFPLSIESWKKIFEIKEYFEQIIGDTVYNLLPNVIENTFKARK